MLNRETNLPVDLMTDSPPETPECPVAYVEWVRQAMHHAFDFVRVNLQTSIERHKTLYDQNSGCPTFSVGQSVWRFYPPIARKKFGKKWEGPYLVIQKVSDLCYKIQKHPRAPSLVVHVDHLKSYEGVHPLQSWLTPGDPNQSEQEGAQLDMADIDEQSDQVLSPNSIVDDPLNASVHLEDLQHSDDGGGYDDEPSGIIDPVPSTSDGPRINEGSRYSRRPRKPKIDQDYLYY